VRTACSATPYGLSPAQIPNGASRRRLDGAVAPSSPRLDSPTGTTVRPPVPRRVGALPSRRARPRRRRDTRRRETSGHRASRGRRRETAITPGNSPAPTTATLTRAAGIASAARSAKDGSAAPGSPPASATSGVTLPWSNPRPEPRSRAVVRETPRRRSGLRERLPVAVRNAGRAVSAHGRPGAKASVREPFLRAVGRPAASADAARTTPLNPRGAGPSADSTVAGATGAVIQSGDTGSGGTVSSPITPLLT